MNKIRITKEFTFEMAHALDRHDGKCKNIHGHSYQLTVTVAGRPIKDDGHPKNGMVIDFADLKRMVNRTIVHKYDHALVLKATSPYVKLVNVEEQDKLILVDYQPSCENLVVEFAHVLDKELKEGVSLHSIRLRETATSFAEWHAADNA